ncbi:hypothetical protein BDK51DRAFT_51778 [Blyttiomyces helicus]|uniref:F-box domain-containing protein n=1 Tax=Blyttiomyces helicus TaxID=388810 RepID=A0A4V1IRR5_9FUNG|nr:hypothetical protein BDK51DRAFT_51778 [Blyttiomyces helicus]|eukprot:RKO90977.1 hypothetical protein BDK51DRAFT_51778 [Blyttiomyces helicus]
MRSHSAPAAAAPPKLSLSPPRPKPSSSSPPRAALPPPAPGPQVAPAVEGRTDDVQCRAPRAPPRIDSRNVALGSLPTELWSRITSFVPDPTVFSRTCRSVRALLQDPPVRAQVLIVTYGANLALFRSTQRRRRLFAGCEFELVRALLAAGAKVPRWWVQLLHRRSLTHPPLLPLETLILAEALRLNPLPPDLLTANDALLFEALTNDLDNENNLETVRDLIVNTGFVPLEEITPCGPFRIYQLSKKDIRLLDVLIERNGLDVRSVNDRILRQVLSLPYLLTLKVLLDPRGVEKLHEYMSRGFILTPAVIASQLRDSTSPAVLQTFREHTAPSVLQSCALEVLRSFFDPDSPIHFPAQTATNILAICPIPDATLQEMILHDAGGRLPYATRCFEQPVPHLAWRWILARFGPGHPLSQSAFADLLLWTADLGPRLESFRRRTKDDPWIQTLHFLDAGVRLRPRHVPALAQIALAVQSHPVPSLVIARQLDWAGHDALPDRERQEWLVAVKDAVVDNKEWNRAARTVDRTWWAAKPRRGKETRPLRFLDEVQEMVKLLKRRREGLGRYRTLKW